MHTVHFLRTHKFHFSAIFSLKMSLTVLFTNLKIILLQYFSVFNFSFQFSTVSKRTLNMHLDCGWKLCVYVFLFLFIYWEVLHHGECCLSPKFPKKLHCSVGLVHFLRDPQTSFFNKIFIKNKSHGTIHTFKNYFVTVFSIFSKISDIQMDS